MNSVPALRIAFAGMAALAVAMGIGRFAFTPILPMMQDDFGLSIIGGSWLASSNYLGYLIAAIAATAWPVRSRGVLSGSLLAVAASTLAMGLTDDFILWAVLRFVAGFASALMFIAVSTRCMAALAERGRPRLTGLVFAGVGSGIAAAGLMSLLLMQYGAGSAWAWRIAGLVALSAAVFVLPVLGAITLPPAPAASDSPRGGLSRHAGLLVLCYGISGFGYIIPATFLPVMAKAVVADVSLFGWSWPVFGAAAVASTFIAAARAAVTGHRSVWIASHWLMAAGVLLPVMFQGLTAVIGSALLVGGTFVVTTMTSLQVAQDVSRGHATRLVAAMTAAFALGQIIGPVVAGLLFDAGYGFSGGLVLAGLLLMLSALLLWRVAPGKKN